ncbi:MAG: DMT family transporter [Actinomycetota bacterium]
MDRPDDEGGRFGLSPNALGSLYMVIGSLGYVTNDALVRAATDEGLDVYQTLFLRSLGMSAILGIAMVLGGHRLPREAMTGPMVWRVAAELVAAALFFAALVRLDFAVAQTILMLVPFAVTVVAARFLDERVTGRHYLAVAVGFLGVLAVVQPVPGRFSGWSLVVIASAGVLVLRELATRRVDPTIPALPIAFLTAVSLAALTGLISAVTGWGTITGRAVLFVVVACGLLIVGYIFTIQTVRVGDLSVSAPFRYSTLVGAVVIGAVAFDEPPGWLTLLGCLLIIAAGVETTRLDRRRPVAG